jgi:hypothetical protein
MTPKQKALAKYLVDRERQTMSNYENLNYNHFENLSTSDVAAMASTPDFMASLTPTLQAAINTGNPAAVSAQLGGTGGAANGGFPVKSSWGGSGVAMVNATYDITISAPVIVVPAGAPAVPNNIFNIPLFGAGVSESNYKTNTLAILNSVQDSSGNFWNGVALPGYLVTGGDTTAWYFTYSSTNGSGTTTITWTITMSFYAYVAFVKDLRNNVLQIDNHRITLSNPNNLNQYRYPYYPSNQSPMGKFGGSAVTLSSYKPPTDYLPYILDFKTKTPWQVTQQDYIVMGFNPNSTFGSPNAVQIAFDVVTFDRSGSTAGQ